MSPPVYRMTQLLSTVLHSVPVGTNLALFQLLWTLVTGRLLAARGALFPALADAGLPPDAVRRAGAALATGHWQLAPLLAAFHQQAQAEGRWQPCTVAGYRPVACDLVGFFRPRLRHCPTAHFSQPAGQTLPAVPFGVVARVGAVGTQRVPLPVACVRAAADDPSDHALMDRALRAAAAGLLADEWLVADRGFPLSQVQAAQVPRFLLRVPRTFTARRAFPPEYAGKGRPAQRGALVRPLPRQRKGRTLPATPPDRTERWQDGKHVLVAHYFDDLVRADQKPGAATFHCLVVFDPRYRDPWVLVTPQPLAGATCRALYPHRWPVEQLPLAAKQMLGASRQFVFGAESRQRLPELAMLAGALLMYAAATQPAVPSGFWDRAPRPTVGRLRRLLARADFPAVAALPAAFRKKLSPTTHLPKGVLGHRRQKRPLAEHDTARLVA
jgi:hypothetical protein